MDEAGNLWLPGRQGTIYFIAKSELSAETPAVETLSSAAIGSVEKLAFHSVPGPLFIAH